MLSMAFSTRPAVTETVVIVTFSTIVEKLASNFFFSGLPLLTVCVSSTIFFSKWRSTMSVGSRSNSIYLLQTWSYGAASKIAC